MTESNMKNITVAESEYLAENELIMISPNFRQRQFDFISVCYAHTCQNTDKQASGHFWTI
jgi:hypothetical protein